jgi:hypothetical protein
MDFVTDLIKPMTFCILFKAPSIIVATSYRHTPRRDLKAKPILRVRFETERTVKDLDHKALRYNINNIHAVVDEGFPYLAGGGHM